MVTPAEQKAYTDYYKSRVTAANANQPKPKVVNEADPSLWNRTSAVNATGNIYKPAVQPQSAPKKSWEQMSEAEQKAELDKVDWNQLGEWMDTQDPTWRDKKEEEVPKTTMPVDGGAAAPAPVSNVDATSQMFADALKALQAQYGVSQENINAAIARMQADPYNTANAYATMQLAPARVAADPLAQYMQAAGLSDQQSAAAAQLSQAEADAYQQAMRNVQNVMSKSQEQANLSRLADIGLISTGAQQDLEANLNMLRLGLERDRIGALTGLQQQNLQNSLDMRNAIANQISNIFAGQDVAPESILKLIEQALSKINTNRWTTFPAPTMSIQPVGSPTPYTLGV